MLDTLPPEIIAHIAHHLVLESCRPPANLLCASRTVYAAASPQHNPNLYAHVFRAHYDMGAAARRLGDLRPADVVAELRTRTEALERLAAIYREIESGGDDDPLPIRVNDLWVVYLMLLENDGKNVQHLVTPLGPGPGVDVVAVVRAYHARNLESTRSFAYPPQRAVDALAMWIAWLLDDFFSERTPAMLRALRPYVFAAHQYDMFFAPWTQPRVPVPRHSAAHSPPSSGPFAFDHMPKDRACAVPCYGRTLTIAPPILSHAALLRFFTAPENDNDTHSSSVASDRSQGPADLRVFPRPVLTSQRHDADIERLIACTDGARSPGRALWAWRGVFAGCWEGTFTFLDFDAYRDMLAGRPAAIYQGAYGEQAQVWKLRETFIRPKQGTVLQGPGLPLSGPMLNAGFPADMRPFAANAISARAPGTSPEDATINDALARQLDALQGYESIPPDELEAELAAATPGDNLGLLVTGVGHSAWGRFIISGHVRVWDGLLFLVKEYAPFQRGKWLYRGYVLGDGAMVGRWRDTFTPEDYVGYEGTFMLNKREQ